jgi:hypothetical protein
MSRRDVVIALSLANLCFLRVWTEILSLAGPGGYYLQPSPWAPWAVMLDVLIVGALMATGVLLARRSPHPLPLRVARAIFLLALFIPLDVLRTEFHLPRLAELAFWVAEPAGRPLPLKDLAPLVPLAVFARWPRRSARAAQALLLFFAPFVLVTFGRALWVGARHDIAAAYAARPLEPALPAPLPATPRVLVLVFDELDQRIAFAQRPAGLALPTLDRLRSEGMYASNATPPAWETLLSFPAFLTGRMVAGARPVGASGLALRFQDEGDVSRDWSAEPTLFVRARALGFNAALVGWYHPYCRVLRALTRCTAEPYFDVISRAGGAGPAATMLEQLHSLTPWDGSRRHVESYRRIAGATAAAAVDPTLGLVFVHWPVPHHPYIYDGARGRLTVHRYGARGYLDQLQLVDRTLGDLRSALERAGQWTATTIVVTSDHGARVKNHDERVPFLVKFAGPGGAVVYDRAFGTVILGDFVLAILRGELRAPAQAAGWLDRHAPPRPVQARR